MDKSVPQSSDSQYLEDSGAPFPWEIYVCSMWRTCKPHVIWQKPTQYCKAIILQLNINKFNYKKYIHVANYTEVATTTLLLTCLLNQLKAALLKTGKEKHVRQMWKRKMNEKVLFLCANWEENAPRDKFFPTWIYLQALS